MRTHFKEGELMQHKSGLASLFITEKAELGSVAWPQAPSGKNNQCSVGMGSWPQKLWLKSVSHYFFRSHVY